ncbi:hypothetical protein SFR_4364 [Streptomyces sp. FR-008]|nr:hypothetical protein SFR_4364 [Streptomyces sp. FR-008]
MRLRRGVFRLTQTFLPDVLPHVPDPDGPSAVRG